ncbi:hypothetical protein R3P38DRAFT_2816858 [Favolaschia claudopus]|uniref:Uncharacterized protein n=1 Tax=Favolaschia claudopus TaxID=2862362 RepID=A0AAV9YYF6_9AGAR
MTSLEAKFYFLLPPGGDPARFSCDPGSDHAPNQLVVDRVPITFPIPGLILNESHVSMWMNCLDNCLLKPPPFTRDCDSGNLAPDATTTVDVEDNFVSQGKEFPCEASDPSTLSSSKRRRDRPEKTKDESERAEPGSLVGLLENDPGCAAGRAKCERQRQAPGKAQARASSSWVVCRVGFDGGGSEEVAIALRLMSLAEFLCFIYRCLAREAAFEAAGCAALALESHLVHFSTMVGTERR